MTFVLNSTAFEDGRDIPRRYARDGENLSPPLTWEGAPSEAKSFALVVEDPDAPNGTFRHWAVFDLPPQRKDLPEGAGALDAPQFRQALNDFGAARYDGPQPPNGDSAHHYHFRLAALDVERLDAPPNAKAEDVLKAAQDHIIDEAELVGAFQRG